MDEKRLEELLGEVASGAVPVGEALVKLRDLPFADLGYATVDHHRALRQGVPEVIFGQGKSTEQIVGIAKELARTGQNVLVTRAEPGVAEALGEALGPITHNALARTVSYEQRPIASIAESPIGLVTAGTSDLPVAEECAETCRMLGLGIERIYDVGVAGIHRILGRRDALDDVDVVIVVAGMEGALASVVGGLVERPVIAVPTSTGYGAAFGGVAALLGMLTSCASGVTVVNIDNGFGAAFATARIVRARRRAHSRSAT